MNKVFFVLLSVLLISSCSPFQKAMKSEDVALKYTVAEEQYEAGKYDKAIRLFEQIAPSFRGKPQAEKLFYMFAQSYYKTNQYYLAGYQFESFVSSYPKSEKLEEAAYLGAFCYSKLAPVYSLDQTDTNRAIDKMQNFIDTYPESTYQKDANLIVKELREKLEKKAFEIAKQHYTIAEAVRDYNAPLVALDNFISDYPGTPFREEAYYLRFEASFEYAKRSVDAKVKIRLEEALVAYDKLIKLYPESKFKEKADKIKAEINKMLQQYSK
ncbi:outer membrane protein assembly factor BamD [Flavobacterium sp.]|uniref:outer membrane protein assembly factor BamD n=1 Tax=Flavobacterium sp. TaxID=239 RepID=UPI002FD94724